MSDQLDSLSQQPPGPADTPGPPEQSTPIPAEHIDVSPIGPSPSGSPQMGESLLPAQESAPQPLPQQGDSFTTATQFSAESLSGVVANPVIETHKGSVPIIPLPGAKSGLPNEPGRTVTSLGQRRAYLWFLLMLGVVFLIMLALVYIGGIYRAR